MCYGCTRPHEWQWRLQRMHMKADSSRYSRIVASCVLPSRGGNAGVSTLGRRPGQGFTKDRRVFPSPQCCPKKRHRPIQLGTGVNAKIVRTNLNIISDCLNDSGSGFVLRVYSRNLSHEWVWLQGSGCLISEFSFSEMDYPPELTSSIYI